MAEPEAGTAAGPLKRQRILVVDDQRMNVRLLQAALQARYDVEEAYDGETAVDLARANQPDLVLLDIDMPGMSGLEVCRLLKASERTQHIPVIFVTARVDEADERKGFELGAVDYIRKPYRIPIVQARVATHLALRRRTQLLETLVAIDGLTEIPNRRRFDEKLAAEWRRCGRAEHCLSVIILDVDFFKRFNDSYGHGAGDDCLRAVAEVLASTMRRPADLAARYGGEEFACVLPDTGEGGALQVAECLRAGVESLGILHAASDAAKVVTVSVGVSTLVPPQKGDSPEAILAQADERLYRAKQAGRNCVVGPLHVA